MKEAQLYLNQELSGIYNEPELQSIIRLILSHCTGLSYTGLIVNKNTTFSENQRDILKNYVSLLKSGMPVQYVLGETSFCNLTIAVGPEVLIPRPETEELVDWAVHILPTGAKVLDIGTGSGCIAIALKYLRPDGDVSACDISTKALTVAAENAKRNAVDVCFFQHDILTKTLPVSPLDLIISNPPYIPASEAGEMEAQVTNFEPGLALFVPDEDPLLFYQTIARQSLHVLSESGQLLVEVHRSYARECVKMLEREGFTDIELRKDIFGNDRMIRAGKTIF